MATIGLVGYVCAYSFSFGPVTWVILSEIFPAATKGQAMAFTTSFNWLGNFIVSATFLQATRKNYKLKSRAIKEARLSNQLISFGFQIHLL